MPIAGKSATLLLVGAEDEENLALRSLWAYVAEHGLSARVAPFSRPSDAAGVLRQIRRAPPDLLAASVAFQSQAEAFFALLRQVRSGGYRGHIVVGGHFPTFEYRRILQTEPAIDSVMRYEGEHGIVQLAQAVVNGQSLGPVPNLVYRAKDGIAENLCRQEFMDLDALPFPQRDRRAQRRLGERFATIIASRGCWHSSCLYCCIGAFHAAKQARFALRDMGSVAEEIALLHRRQGVNLLQFHDDNFVLETPQRTCQRIQGLGHQLQSRGVDVSQLAFLIKARPDVVDASVAAALKDLGCVGVFLGVENATQTGLRALCRGVDLSLVQRSVDLLTAAGMTVTYNLLVFHPHVTMEEIRANVQFIRAHEDLPFDFGRAEIVAGSPLERLAVKEERLCGNWPRWDYRLRDAAVQRAFDIYRVTFRGPQSAYSPLMHALIAVSYHAGVVRRLHGGRSAEAIAAAVRDLLASVNRFVTGRIDAMLALAEGQLDSGAVAAFGNALDGPCREFLRQADALTQELLRLQAAEHVFAWFGIRSMVQELSLTGLFGVRKGNLSA